MKHVNTLHGKNMICECYSRWCISHFHLACYM